MSTLIDGRPGWAEAASQKVASSNELEALRSENARMRAIIEALIGVRLGSRQSKLQQVAAARQAAREFLRVECTGAAHEYSDHPPVKCERCGGSGRETVITHIDGDCRVSDTRACDCQKPEAGYKSQDCPMHG